MMTIFPAEMVFADTDAASGLPQTSSAQEITDGQEQPALQETEITEQTEPELAEEPAAEPQPEETSAIQDSDDITVPAADVDSEGTDEPEEPAAPVSIEEATVKLDMTAYPYTANAVMPVPKVTVTTEDGTEKTLVKDTDFVLTYTDGNGSAVSAPVGVGTYKIKVEGKGDYTGTAKQTVSFTIDALPIKSSSVTGLKDMDYTGRAFTQNSTVKITVGGRQVVLKNGTDYTLSYRNNVKAGTATVVITGKGVYTGTKEVTFKIRARNNTKGWHKLNGEWYYYYKNDKMLTNGWAKDSHGWCYLSSDGRLLRNGWAKDSHGWCWMNSAGHWTKGINKWIRTNGEWYYLRSNGYRATYKWLKDSHGWCYAGGDGTLVKSGWAKDSRRWCWLDANGYWNPGKWRKDNKGWYYRDGTGTLLTNRWVRDSKGWCWVDANGYYDASKRFYQNPSWMVQISTHITNHGLSYYVSPLQVSIGSDRSDHIEAMIGRAYDYLGDPFVVCQSRAPGKGVDCSGIVMQACYAAGIDLWPSNPARHRSPAYEYESREIWKMKNLESVPWSQRQRGDLIFYSNGYGTVIHVAIYLGNNKVVHAYPDTVRVSSVYGWGNIKGVKRIFH